MTTRYAISYTPVGAPNGYPAAEFYAAGKLAQACNGGNHYASGVGAGVIIMERHSGQPKILKINVTPPPCHPALLSGGQPA